MSRTLVFGASGFVGQELLSRLHGKVTAISRAKIMDDSSSVKWCSGDLTQGSSTLPQGLLTGAGVAYHLAANHHHKPQVTQTIVSLCEAHGVKRLIMLSETGSRFGASDEGFNQQYKAEGLAINSMIPEVIIVRVPLLVSKKKSSPFDLYIKEFFRFPLFYPIIRAKSQCALVSVEDLAIYLEKLSKSEVSEPRNIIDIATSQFTMKSIMSFALTQYSQKPKIGLGHIFGSLLGFMIDYWGRKSGRKTMRQNLNRALSTDSEALQLPSGLPKPKVYTSVQEVYSL